MPGGNSASRARTGVRVVVAGDRLTGKSSLIAAAATESFPENVPRILRPTRLPADFFPDRVPITIIDTSSALESRGKLFEELKRADAVVLTYACDQPLTISHLSSFWLEELRRLEIKVPIIVVGCKLDLRDETQPVSLEQVMGPIMQRYREIETCIECSAVTLMQPAEIVGVRRVVQEKKKEGVNDLGLTLEGFLFLHTLFIDKGRLETTWAVLRKFGYDDELKLRDDLLPVPSKHAPDQSIELTIEAVEFLRGIFRLFDIDNHGALRPADLDELFSTAPENPWCKAPYRDAAERTTQRNLTLKGFLSEWDLMTLLDPKGSLANLIYVGYSGNPASALRVTRRRTVDRKKQQTERNVFRCFVFGPKNAGKSALLNSFLERPFSAIHNPTMAEHYAANVVDQHGVSSSINEDSYLEEIPEDEAKKILSNKESLSACDIAIFVYDSSNEYSWKRSCEVLVEVTRRGEESGYGVPCLLVAAKDDLDPYPMAVQDSLAVCQELGIEAPIPVSVILGETNNVFCRILSAAERPHLNIPETEAVGAAFTVVGVAAFRAYNARKNSST
ncbi:hypothetical protein GH714_024790 [Hevea brasiliensis]|uniref:Mitochondrial Rho GTPase n=1 Tax=Hevea brasiliensis TaxID=3981 RepID=A0A6A6NJ62_HEVBR|nr:hypothetical protein GH714_024790 [Hevea brasiliensis]